MKAKQWLQNLKGKLQNKGSIPKNLPSLLTSLMLTTKCQQEIRLGLDVLVNVTKADPAQAISLLPFLLYYMGKTDDPDVKMATMKSIPLLAQHKYVVPPIMRTIQLLGTNPALKSTSLQLLTDLWLLQDRTYPHLLKAIVDDAPHGETGKYSNDILLAKAKAVREVCKTRGGQHGADMLGPISSILDKCTCPYGGASAALALEGLYYLCEEEVIDIQSAWSVLGDQLSRDTRDVVKGMICQLFSLLPELLVKTPEFEKFQEFVLSILWLSAQKEGSQVSSAALESLSHYCSGDFKISHMADHIIEDFIAQGKSTVQLEEGQEFNIDDVIPYVPGVCYTRLLKELSPDILKSYTNFLSAMVREEVENLPRGVFYSSLRQQGAVSNQNKAVLSIPDFIIQQYEKTRQPGLRPGLAAGLLFSYDIPVDVGRDGKPRKHGIITRSKNYQQMFSTLLHEVIIQPSDWHRCMVSPQAWTTFVERLFGAMLEGRQAEIELQVKRDHISESDAEEKLTLSWMWVREQITDIIKGASRGSPTMQGNAILSLAGLAWVVHKHVCGLDKESRVAADNSTEYKSHSHWLTVVIDTMMSLMDITYAPKGQLLGLCQQRSADDRLPAGILAQATAVVSFSQLVPFLVTMDTEIIFKVISLLQSRLPGETEASDSPVVQFHVGLGLGRFLAGLIEDHFLDICGTKGVVEIWRVLDLYEQCCFSDDDNISGALLGLGLVMSALCQDGKTEGRAHVASVLDKLIISHKTATEPNQAYQALCVCLAMTAVAAFSANVLSTKQIDVVITSLVDSTIKYPQMSGPCLSFGLLSYSLQRLGHPGISETRKQIYDSWIKQWNDPDTSCVQQMAVLTGMMAMVGTERTLVPIQSDTTSSIPDISADDVVRVTKTAVTSSTDQGVQSSAAWILGHLYLAVSTATQSRASVPPNYGYLPEQSFIRALVDYLIDSGKQGPEFVPDDYVSTVLTALQSCTKRPLPPLNWTGVLSPLMRINYGDRVKDLTLRLGVQQSLSLQSAAMFLTAWMLPPLYTSLPDICVHQMYDSLPVLIKSASADTIKSFLQQGQRSYTEVKDTFHHFLLGFHRALKVNDPPESVTSVLYQAVKEVYKLPITEYDTLHLIAECLGSIPDDLFDSVTEADSQSEESFMKGLFVRCYLVGQGRQPIAVLNSFIDACISNPTCDFDTAETLLQHMFWQMTKYKTDFTSAMDKLKWLTDLLGHLSNEFKGGRKVKFLQEAYSTESKSLGNISFIYKFAASTLASAVTLWTHLSSPIFLDIRCDFLSNEFSTDPFAEGRKLTLPSLFESSVTYFPVFVDELLNEPWSQILPKVYDWIGVFTSDDNAVDEKTSILLDETVMTLRNSTDFRKPNVWTEFINRVDIV
ncbi:hypothetical protein FSP39_012361 [Pinctada imbricata]|uniref:DUF3730 domain-containing protein n=1 Tax=Pinctada imbricata TaxID=66713 RepID=A0AA89BX54_PINIB|nr:hypothetical protein FSP39_012361 [Pinctada imbricata]